MKKKLILFFTVLLTINGFADLAETTDSPHPERICSPTECYKILKELGEGAFGKVYAVENSVGQLYAIKSYKSHKDFNLAQHILANAEREYMRGQLLNHSNIVKTFDLFEIHSSPDHHTTYLVLELVDGKTVVNLPKRSLRLNQALHCSLQFIDALRYALSQDLLYLDLHGNNIMVADSSDAMVIDLASFYSFDEIFNFVEKKEEKDEKENIKPKTAKDRAVRAQIQLIKEKKLKRFFLQNPKLFEKLQKIKKIKKINKKDKNHKNGKLKIVDPDQMKKMSILSYYFDTITEICVQLITKSDLAREKKLKLRTAIKLLAWNYSEDLEEDLFVPIDDYFDRLIHILQS